MAKGLTFPHRDMLHEEEYKRLRDLVLVKQDGIVNAGCTVAVARSTPPRASFGNCATS